MTHEGATDLPISGDGEDRFPTSLLRGDIL